ncbi:phage replisome organizer N-terminal domain-containing protein [Geotalea toluenoxydans]|uniref:phage replisome organizer N-terminal domain-containing protein n=1 Tax=Geotalea toluenoxydans TaxID=421624 RepID=UPI0006D000C5|nr:phage replisome organizer N-terminal domain-containing protein [Geotalea toluenoxydans]
MDWIKVVCNILDHRKIKLIRKGPEGNTLVLLWLLMMTEAGKCNRGGYLMVSDSLPYSAETLSMLTDIPLPTVQLGIKTFTGLSMIDQQDGAIYIKNWGKYQSEEKLEARREKDRERKQRQRQKERAKILALEGGNMQGDCHGGQSRDVTPENRHDRKDYETTEHVRFLFTGTPFSRLSETELQDLAKRHGFERLLQAADIAAETWRRSREELHNPGGYIQSLCASLVIPEWYVPFEDRKVKAETIQQRKAAKEAKEAALKAHEEAQMAARDALWASLPEERQEKYLASARANLPEGLTPPIAVLAMGKLLAWEASQL